MDDFKSNVTFEAADTPKIPCSLECSGIPFRSYCCYTEYWHARCCDCC